MLCEPNLTFTFEQALTQLDRGRFEGLERLLLRVANSYRITRDDVWTVASDLWRFVQRTDRAPLSAWEGRVAGFLTNPAGRSALLGARGLRPADARAAEEAGTTFDQARTNRFQRAHEHTLAFQAPVDRVYVDANARHHDVTRRLERLLPLAGADVSQFIEILSNTQADPEVLRVLCELPGGVGVALLRAAGYRYKRLAKLTGKKKPALRMANTRGKRRLEKLCAQVDAEDEVEDDS